MTLGMEEDVGFRIGNRSFSRSMPLIIAEIGSGHGGDLKKAAELIRSAADAGAQCAKFQFILAREIIHPKTGLVRLPGGAVRLFERFRDLELELDFYRECKALCEALGLIFLCSPFGLESAAKVESLEPQLHKVASPELNFPQLIQALAAYGRPLILSSGVSRLSDIESALAYSEGLERLLLHCVTAYPAPPSEYNLRILPHLSKIFGIAVGVSDHSLDPILVPVISQSQGACAIEKHFCLSRQDPGLDDPIALEPSDFQAMSQALRECALLSPDEAVREMSDRYGKDLVQACLGNGRKALAPSEADNYGRTNRSIHALRDIKRGEPLTSECLGILRTEKVLSPGLSPGNLALCLGRLARRDIADGQGLQWDDVGDIG